jgi:predicted nuclease of predicted toxin-antitoxin system
MNLYLDDDLAGPQLARLLRNDGHDVRLPADLRNAGAKDPIHLRHAIREGRVLLTRNYDDFELLHLLIQEANGHHPGILLIRRDNDPRRNMGPGAVVRALRNLEASGLALPDSCYELNPWQ